MAAARTVAWVEEGRAAAPPHSPSRCGGQDVAADSAAGSNHSRDCGDVCERRRRGLLRPPLPDRHGHCFKEIARGPRTRGKERERKGDSPKSQGCPPRRRPYVVTPTFINEVPVQGVLIATEVGYTKRWT